jgi:sugar phosphate isomerase/epimerase
MTKHIHRRHFVQSAALAASAGFVAAAGMNPLLAATTNPQKFKAGFAPATDGTLESFWHNMEACSKVGFHHIEVDNSLLHLAEAYGDRPEEFKDRMAKLNLKLVGLNHSYPLLDPTKHEEISKENRIIGKFLKGVGAIYAGPYGALSDDEEPMRKLAKFMEEEGKRMRGESGVVFAYHTHSSTGFRRLMDLTNPAWVNLTIDMGWITMRGSSDAIEVLRAYHSRLMTLHLKDFDPDYEFDYRGEHYKGGIVLPGKGIVDFPGVVAFLKESEWKRCFLGEHIGLGTYDYVRTPESVNAYPHFRDYMEKQLGLSLNPV